MCCDNCRGHFSKWLLLGHRILAISANNEDRTEIFAPKPIVFRVKESKYNRIIFVIYFVFQYCGKFYVPNAILLPIWHKTIM